MSSLLCNSILSSTINLAIGGPWVSLHPGLQHTVWADVVLSNQFEALVGTNNQGQLKPLGAKSWTISENGKKYTFFIDTEKKFSDGSPLTSSNYKKSWEESLKLDPKSANNSLLDVLYFVDGISDFERSGVISGLDASDPKKLVINFAKPSRIMLHHLAGNRFAAYKVTSAGMIGTGKYTISEIDKETLFLKPNRYFAHSEVRSDIRLHVVPSENIGKAIADKKIDGLAWGRSANLDSSILSDPTVEVLPGPEANHHALDINGLPGKFFANVMHRRALQYLLINYLKNKSNPLGDPRLTTVDAQVFLPLQAGRIPESDITAIIDTGQAHVASLRQSSQAHPIVIKYMKPWAWVREALESQGIAIAVESKQIEYTELLNQLYKDHDFDLLVTAFSVVDGDPDGIYHAIGKTGAILCPAIYREAVGQLVEEGREIIDSDKVDPHYQKVSRQILQDVPFVHLGFSRSVAVMSKNRVDVDKFTLSRIVEGHFDVFQPK